MCSKHPWFGVNAGIIYIYIEREREREIGRESKRERERVREFVCQHSQQKIYEAPVAASASILWTLDPGLTNA